MNRYLEIHRILAMVEVGTIRGRDGDRLALGWGHRLHLKA